MDAPGASGIMQVSGHSFSGSFLIFKMRQGHISVCQGTHTPNQVENRKKEEEIRHFCSNVIFTVYVSVQSTSSPSTNKITSSCHQKSLKHLRPDREHDLWCNTDNYVTENVWCPQKPYSLFTATSLVMPDHCTPLKKFRGIWKSTDQDVLTGLPVPRSPGRAPAQLSEVTCLHWGHTSACQ